MNVASTDLLPPLFDRILLHYSKAKPGNVRRSEIIRQFESCIVEAAAQRFRTDSVREVSKSDADNVVLETFDRLSGPDLSRSALIEQVAVAQSLEELVVEIALLLIEAQIDLRFKFSPQFEIDGIRFERAGSRESEGAAPPDPSEDTTEWCRTIVPSALSVSAGVRPTLLNWIGASPPEGLRVLVESLPLSATLRQASPYRISVAHRRVASIVPRQREQAIRLLHISDLHIVEDLPDPRRGGSPTAWQKTHNFETTRMAGQAIDSLQPKFDCLVATGDLTAEGKRESFETVLQYVQGGSISGENRMRIAARGLGAGRDRRLMLPGNHDRFEGKPMPGQRVSYLMEEVLGTPTHYPYLRAYRPPTSKNTSDLTLLFFVFDSTLPEGQEKKSLGGFVNALSQGRIGKDELDEAAKLARNAVATGSAPAFDGPSIEFDPENTVRIALLHHHPVKEYKEKPEEGGWKAVKRAFGFMDRSDEAMKLNGADDFLRHCLNTGIQLVLFGHDHNSYRRVVYRPSDAAGLRAFCCPTTLEHSEKGTGFYVFDFLTKDGFTLDAYVSADANGTPTPFQRSAKDSPTFSLNQLSDAEIATAHTFIEAKPQESPLVWKRPKDQTQEVVPEPPEASPDPPAATGNGPLAQSPRERVQRLASSGYVISVPGPDEKELPFR
jgi:3',5'-cyclic AMP phosphodiesterase CpdA